jgi:regulator of protease activity HflC (stomatin/prohibitin superfamily)
MNFPQQNLFRNIVFAVLAVFLFIMVIAFFPIVVVGVGQRGVVFNNASGIEDRILGEGVHVRVPFLQTVTKVSVRVQKTEVKAEAASKDLQTVRTDVVVNWHMNAGKVNKIFQEVGDEEAVEDRILAPAVNEVVKAATAQKTASEILSKRPELKRDIDTALNKRLTRYNLVLDDVSITNVSFTPEFNKAIEDKQIAQQQAEQAKFLVEKARNEAEANQAKQQSITPQILQQRALEKWDGHFPTYWGAGALPFINITPQ